MNFDDESLLSAYLDGELSAEEHAEVEQSLAANPRLGDILLGLTEARDWVAGLERPLPPLPLTGSWVERIAALRAQRRRRARHLVQAAVGLSAAAAVALIALRPLAPGVVPLAGVHVLTQPEVATLPPPAPWIQGPRPVNVLPSPSLPAVSRAIRPELLAAEIEVGRNAGKLRDLLERGGTREIVVALDHLDPTQLERVEDVIRRSNRHQPESARITRPGEVVFVLSMDDVERNQFRKNLEDRLPGAAGPDVAAETTRTGQLATVDRVEFRGDIPRGTLMNPPTTLAERAAIRHEPNSPVAHSETIPSPPRSPVAAAGIVHQNRPTLTYLVVATPRPPEMP